VRLKKKRQKKNRYGSINRPVAALIAASAGEDLARRIMSTSPDIESGQARLRN
jgi:hypothetical protein